MTYIKGKQLYIDDLNITTLRIQQDVYTTGSIMSLGTGSYITGSLDGNATSAISASYAVTASYISGFIASASYAITSSYSDISSTSSYSNNLIYITNTSGSDASYTINLNGGDNIILPVITAGRTVTFPAIVDGKLIWVWNQNNSVNTWSIAGFPLVESTLLGTQTTITNQTYTAYIGSSAQSAWIRVI